MILVALFYFFDSKEMYLLHQHVPKKMFRLYFSSGFIFIFNLIFVFTMLPFVGRISEFFEANIKIKATFGIIFGVSAFISLITIAVYRYAKYKIDLTLYLRRRGKDDTTKTEQNLEKPTSSIVDHADQK
jgi:hypothetical protein